MPEHVLGWAFSLLRHFQHQKHPNNNYFAFFVAFYTELNFVLTISVGLYIVCMLLHTVGKVFSSSIQRDSSHGERLRLRISMVELLLFHQWGSYLDTIASEALHDHKIR